MNRFDSKNRDNLVLKSIFVFIYTGKNLLDKKNAKISHKNGRESCIKKFNVGTTWSLCSML